MVLILSFTLLGIEKRPCEGGRNLFFFMAPSPAVLRLRDEFLSSHPAVAVRFTMREHVPDDRASAAHHGDAADLRASPPLDPQIPGSQLAVAFQRMGYELS